MKYTNKSQKPFKSIDKQLEEKAYKYAIRTYRNITPEIFKSHKNYYIEQYFKEFPKMKIKYNRIKKERKKIALLLTLGALSIGTIGKFISHFEEVKDNERQQAIEMQVEINNQNSTKMPNINDTEYDSLIDYIQNIKDDEKINYNRKQIIAEAYNIANPSNQITADRLGIKKYTPQYLIVRKDKLGNIIETRMKSTIEQGEEIVKGVTEVYKYFIDGELVAVYDKSGTKILDSDIKNEDTFFENTIDIVYQSERLKDVYTYSNSKASIKECQEEYVESAIRLKEKSDKIGEMQKVSLKENEGNSK